MTLQASAVYAEAITPADSDLANQLDTLYIGGTGDVRVTTVNGQDVTFIAVPVGFFPVRVKRVSSTNTDATSIIGLRFS